MFTPWGQLAAAEVLTTAINVTTDHDTTTDTSWTSSPGNQSDSTSSLSSSHVGAIAGGVCGTVAAFVFISAIFYGFYLRRRRVALATHQPHISAPEPYTGTIQQYPAPGCVSARTIVPSSDPSGRLLKHEHRNTVAESSVGPRSVLDEERTQGGGASSRQVTVDIGVLQRLVATGLREALVVLSDSHQRDNHSRSGEDHTSEPPEYNEP